MDGRKGCIWTWIADVANLWAGGADEFRRAYVEDGGRFVIFGCCTEVPVASESITSVHRSFFVNRVANI